jgi:hypothetical protein
MATRTQELQAFLNSLEENFAAAGGEPEVAAVVGKLFNVLKRPAPTDSPAPIRLPVCRCLPEALNLGKSRSPQLARLASTFEAIEPKLEWMVRPSGGPSASANWPEGHANATIIGRNRGLERRDDVAIGVSLLAPNVRYPDHHHAPEEVYLLLTPGRFQHGVSDWFEPGAGGTLHNAPNVQHAMASQNAPLLAFWCLLLD